MPRLAPVLLILLAVLLVYGQSLSHRLVWDDADNIIHNPALRESPLSGGWLASPSAPTRVLANLSFALEYRLWGLAPAGYHASNLLLHLANGLLVYSLALGLSAGSAPFGAGLAGWLFAVHPVNVEAVNSIALGRGYLLATLFALAAVRLAVAAARAGGPSRWGPALAAAACSAVSHEIGAVAIVLVIAVGFLKYEPSPAMRRWSPVVALVAAGLPLSLLLAWMAGMSGVGPPAPVTAAALALKQLMVPVPLCLWYDAAGSGSASTFGPIGVLALILALALVVATVVRRSVLLWLSGLLFVLALLPAMGRPLLPFPLPSLLGERWLYLPAAFMAIWAGVLAQSWRGAVKGRTDGLAAGALLAAICLAAAGGTAYAAVQTRHWRDNATLFEHAVRHCPPSAYLHAALGKAYYDRKETARANEQFRSAAAIDPSFARARIGLGLVALDGGQPLEALRELTAAIRLAPQDADAHNGLGEVYNRLRRHEAALHEFQQAARLRPWQAVYHWNLALAYEQVERYEEAVGEWERVIALSPDPDERKTALHAIDRLTQVMAEHR
ncbi:MAG: tetratricopeptide repeat protein [Nitrospirota bacterium]